MLNIGIISTWHVHTDDYAGQLPNSVKAKIIAVWDFDAALGGGTRRGVRGRLRRL